MTIYSHHDPIVSLVFCLRVERDLRLREFILCFQEVPQLGPVTSEMTRLG